MPYGKPNYDPINDEFTCEFPIKDEDGIYEICNKIAKDLVRHITRSHGITSNEYRKMLGLKRKESLMSKKTIESLRKANRKYGAFRNLRPDIFAFKKGDNTIQSYTRSPQDRARLRRLHLYTKRELLKKDV